MSYRDDWQNRNKFQLGQHGNKMGWKIICIRPGGFLLALAKKRGNMGFHWALVVERFSGATFLKTHILSSQSSFL